MKADRKVLHDISDHRYTVSVAKTDEEIEAALRLRYKVFYEELQRQFRSAQDVDQDKFDDQCHHLIVTENETGNIIGTYRLQTYEQAVAGEGYYSHSLFKLSELPEQILTQSFEVGRACISEEHRNGRVLFLLWKGFAGYLKHFNKQYLTGCLGIPAVNKNEAFSYYKQLEEEGELHEELRVSALEPYQYNQETGSFSENENFEAPTLLRNYLKIGCKIISKPAYHPDLKLLYVMILLDIETISDRTRKMFFG